MKNKRTYLDRIDEQELGIKPGTTDESKALEYIPYWDADPHCAYYYCEGEELIKNGIEPVKQYRVKGLAHAGKRDRHFFTIGYNAALRDVINLLKVEGILEVYESGYTPDDVSPYDMIF